jgi:hypothetical protein
MLKRLLPLLFVVFVTLATVFLFLAFREPPDGPTVTPQAPAARGSGGPGPLAGQGVPAPDGVTEYRVASEEDYLLALEALGTSPEEIEAWARSRGFPPATFTAAAGIPLDQPYRRYDGDTLRGLAESGDVWAMQFLAADLARARPLEAALWYRAAALRGSVFAARELAGLYHDIDRALATGRTEHWETGIRQGVDALAEAEDPLAATALAWLLAAETEGSLPAGSLALTQAGFHDPTPLIAEACARAGAILAELASRREAAGIEAPPRRPPPFSVELPPEETAGYCAAGTLRRPDYTGCETVRLVSDTGAVTAHRCPGAD